VSLPEDLGADPLEDLDEYRVRVGQRQDEQHHLPQHPVHLGHGVAEVDLSLAASMRQRDEDLPGALLDLAHRRLHLGDGS
jgi:hypothetical protein